ncbi:MAG: FAD-dependent oxidoreductase, partial [Nitrolancea sp.]
MKRDLHRLADDVFDVAVIGGGILGAWVAWDATLRGLSVVLIERGDFASGTSSNSLKVIHGGLRYLQSGDVKRMRESIYERSVLMRVAPHLVHPLPVTIPLYGHGIRGPEGMRAALAITDCIGMDRNRGLDSGHCLPRGRILSRDECLKRLPDIVADDLTGGAVWYDAQLYDSERLVLAVLQSAASAGAIAANYVEATDLMMRSGRVGGVHALDRLTNSELSVQARVVVNAAGPWAAQFSSRHGAVESARRFRLSKAFNLAVPQIFSDTAVGFPSKAAHGRRGRMFFATPWRDLTLIGTAHLPYDGDPDRFTITESEIGEFVDDFNAAYPAARIDRQDVVYVHTGLLPAISPSTIGDEVQVAEHPLVLRDGRRGGPEGLITVTNVKYTTSRKVASQTVDAVAAELASGLSKSKTDSLPVYGGDIHDNDACI